MEPLGDFLFTTPAIRAYKQRLPEGDELVAAVGNEQFMKIAEGNPYIDKLVYISEAQHKTLIAKYTKYDDKDTYKGLGKLVEFPTKSGDKEMGCVLEVGKAFNWCSKHPKLTQLEVGGVKKPFVVVPHFSYGFADQLGVNIDSTHYDICLTEEEIQEGRDYLSNKYEKPVILCAALSKSCTSRHSLTHPGEPDFSANKMLSAEIWNTVVEEMKGDYDFVFVAGPSEPLIAINAPWEQGLPIRKVTSMCKASKAVVSIDTGVGHLAAGVDANIVSICAAVPRSLTSIEHTRGKYYCVDHTQENPFLPQGINHVTAEEIIEGIKKVV